MSIALGAYIAAANATLRNRDLDFIQFLLTAKRSYVSEDLRLAGPDGERTRSRLSVPLPAIFLSWKTGVFCKRQTCSL
jgi:hypothetical protein